MLSSDTGGLTFEDALRRPPPRRLQLIANGKAANDSRTVQLKVEVEDAGGWMGKLGSLSTVNWWRANRCERNVLPEPPPDKPVLPTGLFAGRQRMCADAAA